jgi:hypothetical protein
MLLVVLQLTGCKTMVRGMLNAQEASKQEQTTVNCPEVELIGLSETGLLDAHFYCAKVRNKASYTKNVTIEWVDMYGQKKQNSFNVPAGQMIDGRLTANSGNERKPQNLRIAACY